MNSFINFIHNNIEYVQIFNNYAPYIVAIEFIGLTTVPHFFDQT